MPSRRKERPQLVNPHLGLVQEQLRAMAIKPGKEVDAQAGQNRRSDDFDRAPVPIRGNLLDGSATRAILALLEDLGFADDQVEDVGSFGVREFPYASLIQPQSPRLHFTYSAGSDVSSSSNTTTPAQAIEADIVLDTGKLWSVLVIGFLNVRHSADSSARLNLEIEGVDYLGAAVSVFNASYTTLRIGQLVTDLVGETTVDIRLMYRPQAAGTVTASNPTVFVYAWRQE